MKKINAEQFKKYTSADKPILVEFSAEWCGPCKMLEPVLDELSEEFEGKMKVVKIDVDENHELAERYNVRGIPTMILFKSGEKLTSMVGYQNKQRITSIVSTHV